jgi:hypothetical protein
MRLIHHDVFFNNSAVALAATPSPAAVAAPSAKLGRK